MIRKRLKEIWKDVSGYEGYYQVSNLGRVRSLDREVAYKNGRIDLLSGRLLKYGNDKNGYPRLFLSKDGKKKLFLIHRLVLIAFVGPCPSGMEACHKNGIRTDNMVYNLRWDTSLANSVDSKKHGTNPEGERNGLAKLTEKDVANIRLKYRSENISQTKLGKLFGVSQGVISYVVNRKTWTHI